MSESVEAILQDRFYHEGETTWDQVCARVADAWHCPDAYQMMRDRDALPNTPAIANAGRERQMGSACYVLPIADSLTDGPASIMQTLKDAAAVHKSGGGTGFDFSDIRPSGELVRSTGRPAPGPQNVLRVYSHTLDAVTQGGMRPGANMAIIDADHPDCLNFVHSKATEGDIHNFNISVALTDSFMRRVLEDDPATVRLFDELTYQTWLNGEPGAFFVDTVNDAVMHPEPISATNPCGEVPLRPYEACVLGSVNLANHVRADGVLDLLKLQRSVDVLVKLLDNIIEYQDYPLPEIEREQKRYRKIGVGMMGLADYLVLRNIRYDSHTAVVEARYVTELVQEFSYLASKHLAGELGYYAGFVPGMPQRRNLNCQVIAPTGTISRLAECSFGIEPHFDVDLNGNMESYVVGGKGLDEHGNMVPFLDHNPYHDSEYFVPASQVSLDQHIAMQAAVQAYTDQAVSKTINCAHTTTHEEVKAAFVSAWQAGLKGFTLLREGSRESVVVQRADSDGLCESGVCET